MIANSFMKNVILCINLQQDCSALNLKEDVLSDPANAWNTAKDFACSHAKVCGDCVEGYHSGCLSSLKEIQISAVTFTALM